MMSREEIHLFHPSFGLLPSAINHFALQPPSCTSSEVGPLPFPPLCIGGMWHATDPTHTRTHAHTDGTIPPKGRLVQTMCRCAEQHFWRPHTQTVVLPLVLRWAISVMRVVMLWWRVNKVFSSSLLPLYEIISSNEKKNVYMACLLILLI